MHLGRDLQRMQKMQKLQKIRSLRTSGGPESCRERLRPWDRLKPDLPDGQYDGGCRAEAGLVGDERLQEAGVGSRGLQSVGRTLDLVPSVLRSHRRFWASEWVDFTYASCMDHETWGMIKSVGKRETGAGGKHEVRGREDFSGQTPSPRWSRPGSSWHVPLGLCCSPAGLFSPAESLYPLGCLFV